MGKREKKEFRREDNIVQGKKRRRTTQRGERTE